MKAHITDEGSGTQARTPARGPCPAALLATLLAVAAGSAGCHGLFNSWLDPTAVGDFGAERTIEIRTSLSIQDSPLGVPGATTPTPDDLVPTRRPYRFIPGDVMIVRIFELLARNTEAVNQTVVDDMGNISLPFVGVMAVEGLSPRELEGDLKELLREREILNDAEVVVELQIRRNATFVIFGANVGSSRDGGMYPVSTVDFRLLEALSLAGGLSELVTDIYVFREEAVAAGDQTGIVPRVLPPDAARPESSSPEQPEVAAPDSRDFSRFSFAAYQVQLYSERVSRRLAGPREAESLRRFPFALFRPRPPVVLLLKVGVPPRHRRGEGIGGFPPALEGDGRCDPYP